MRKTNNFFRREQRADGACVVFVSVMGGDSLRFSVDLRQERRGLPLVRHIPPLVMPLDMPRSLCALDHAGTGKEESSAKRKRDSQID